MSKKESYFTYSPNTKRYQLNISVRQGITESLTNAQDQLQSFNIFSLSSIIWSKDLANNNKKY